MNLSPAPRSTAIDIPDTDDEFDDFDFDDDALAELDKAENNVPSTSTILAQPKTRTPSVQPMPTPSAQPTRTPVVRLRPPAQEVFELTDDEEEKEKENIPRRATQTQSQRRGAASQVPVVDEVIMISDSE